MTQKILFPSAIDYIRLVNDNIVDNALGKRSSFVILPSLYQRAYALCYETVEVEVTSDVLAPNESVTAARKDVVNTKTATR